MSTVSRRQILSGIGAATAAGAVAMAMPATAGASPVSGSDPDGGFGTSGDSLDAQLSAAVVPPLVEGLAYQFIDPTAFDVLDNSGTNGRVLNGLTGVTVAVPPGALFGPIDVPLGAVITDVMISYIAPATTLPVTIFKKAFDNQYNIVATTNLPSGAGRLTGSLAMSETVDGTASYMVFATVDAGEWIGGVRVGYIPPPQAFVAISPVHRVLDTRLAGGKLAANEERTVPLGVPAFAKAAVLNLTVTETEQAGFVAVFPANVPWPGNSSINWSETGQNLANGVITATDPTGNVKIRGGVAPTHVVMDVQGYLL
jgi:hypothetical protein